MTSAMRARRRQVLPGEGHLRRLDRRVPTATGHVVGIATAFSAVGMLVCIPIEAATGGPGVGALAASTAIASAIGLGLWRTTRAPTRVSAASAFAAVSWTWVVVSIVGALPFWFSGMLPRLDDALFESVSGFTATGSTVLPVIEGNGRGLLMWRQLTQWYGGMGMVVLAVAVLPLLGVGGLELLRAEGPGPTSDRLAPKVSQTAARLWIVYVVLTAATAVGLLLTGQTIYDSVAHAVTAVATGGFSPYNTSVLAFDSVAVELVLIAGMVAGAISFTLWYQVLRGRGLGVMWRSVELRLFLAILTGATVFIAAVLVGDGLGPWTALRHAAFNVVSLMSTCGFGTVDFVQWPAATQLVLLALMVTGGMAGSTSGAVKLFRVQVVYEHARREIRRAQKPRAVFPLKVGGHAVPEDIVARIVGFVLLYVVLALAGVVLLAGLGESLATSSGSVITAMGGVGPGLDETGPASNFLTVSRPSRAVLCVFMLLGRLELFSMLLMFAAPLHVLRTRRRPARNLRRHGLGAVRP